MRVMGINGKRYIVREPSEALDCMSAQEEELRQHFAKKNQKSTNEKYDAGGYEDWLEMMGVF